MKRISNGYEPYGLGDRTLDAWGTPQFTHPFLLFHGLWTFDIPPSMWFMYENGTQVYSSTNIISTGGVAKLTADSTNTVVLLESRECPRYQPDRGHRVAMAGWLPLKTADGIRDFGLINNDSAVFFRLKADGLLYAVIESGGVEIIEDLIDTTKLAGFDVEKSNIYDIQFQWRSAGDFKFFIGNPGTGEITLVKHVKNLGTQTAASIENPAIPAWFRCTRTTEDVTMYIGCADITSEGGTTEVHQYGSSYADNVSVTGTDAPVIVVHIPLLIGTKTNTRTLQLARITMTCTKRATFKIWTTRHPADITGETLVAIGNGEFTETDSPDKAVGAIRATSVTTANMQNITSVPVNAAVTREVDNPLRERINFPLVRGDYLVVTCTASSANADVVVEWGTQI